MYFLKYSDYSNVEAYKYVDTIKNLDQKYFKNQIHVAIITVTKNFTLYHK